MICFFEHYRSVVLNAYFVLGPASSLDAFSSYLEGRSYSAVLVRQPIDQRPHPHVPLVLVAIYLQIRNRPER